MATAERSISAAKATKMDYLVRFGVSQRIEHLALMVSFILLVFTGLPQKFHGALWADSIILALGGIDVTRLIHRFFGLIFLLGAVYHVSYVAYLLFSRKGRPSMVPNLKDAYDAVAMLKYCLGLSQEQPKFGRYDYRQKFEYWGIIFGGVVMILTGLILAYSTKVTFFLPGELVPAAKEAHSNEALLAFLTIVVWHLYGAHLGPGRFPFDPSIFTGRISKKRMLEEHTLEYAQLVGGEGDETPDEAQQLSAPTQDTGHRAEDP